MLWDAKTKLCGTAMKRATTGLVLSTLSVLVACSNSIDYQKPLRGSGGSAGSGSVGGSGAGGETAAAGAQFILGADISGVNEEENLGISYEDTDGSAKSIFDILKNHGFNFIRLRAFVKPGAMYGYAYGTGGSCVKSEAYCDTAHTVAYAQLAKVSGMGVLLDLHYSDNWADPSNQIIPEDWRKARTIDELAGYVSVYTNDIVTAMVDAGARPDIVQIGNEITPGMLKDIPNNKTDCWGNNVSASVIGGSTSNWANLGTLLKSGAEAVKAVDSSIKVMVHIENTQSASGVINWVSNASDQGVPFDIVGLSCYDAFQGSPEFWEAAFNALASTFPTLTFVIAEYNGQRTAANLLMRNMPDNRGLGTFFWEPTLGGAWGGALFTQSGSVKRANIDDFAEFDAIASSVGLK